MNDSKTNNIFVNHRLIELWLLFVIGSIFVMAVVGAITRLTESGLSIMEWAPIKGTLPPLSQVEWERLFALYKTIPEYQWENAGMTLQEFKTIFWWEWIHRLWGRLIGLIFAVPLVFFWVKRALPQWLKKHLLIALLLGGLQGFMGWYMVASGFGDRTDVSQYRLAAHLSLALLILGYLYWLFLNLRFGRIGNIGIDSNSKALGLACLSMICLTVISGAFVAGLNAGMIYNTFPLMGGDFIPSDYFTESGFLVNSLENPAAVQWNHRLLAISTVLVISLGFILHRGSGKYPHKNLSWALLLAGAWLQAGLGITALLLVVPIWAGALHQAGAILLLILGIRCFFFENLPENFDSSDYEL